MDMDLENSASHRDGEPRRWRASVLHGRSLAPDVPASVASVSGSFAAMVLERITDCARRCPSLQRALRKKGILIELSEPARD